MVEFNSLAGFSGAFFAGMVTSLHCSLMCGPLACFLVPNKESNTSYATVATVYHLSRITSYTVCGIIAGGIGMLALEWITIYQHSIARFMPWALVLFFFLVATRLDQFLPKPKAIGRFTAKLQVKAQKLPKLAAASSIGALTPLLPCGPLYAMFTLALMTQSPLQGAEFLLAFSLGTLPLLWIVQAGFSRWKNKISPQRIVLAQRILAGAIGIILGLRLFFFEIGEHGIFCNLFN